MWTQVVLTERAHAIVLSAARAAMPAEMVAVLGGERTADAATVLSVLPLTDRCRDGQSAHPSAAFAGDPVAFARCEHELRRLNQTFLGFAHSHPAASAAPSARDRAELWRDCLQLIIGPMTGRDEPDLRAFVLLGPPRLPSVQPLPLAIEVPR